MAQRPLKSDVCLTLLDVEMLETFINTMNGESERNRERGERGGGERGTPRMWLVDTHAIRIYLKIV